MTTAQVELMTAIQDIRDRLARVETKVGQVLLVIEDHDRVLNGNGKPGLKAEVHGMKMTLMLVQTVGAMLLGAVITYVVKVWFHV